MSGEPIMIVATEDSDVSRFVDAISRLPHGLPDWVLVGGVAVVLRVGGSHRATVDIDTLVRESDRLVELLLGGGGEQRAAHKLVVPIATQLDVMAVGVLPERSSVELSEYVFALAREWAFTTAPEWLTDLQYGRSRRSRRSRRFRRFPHSLAFAVRPRRGGYSCV